MKTLILFILYVSWSYARQSETTDKRKMQLKKLPTIFLNEHIGTAVTLNCPIRQSVLRMYRYLNRIKSGKELEKARRQVGSLLRVRYKWYKDGEPIRHHRSAWFMKLEAIQLQDKGVYTCKVVMPKHGASRNFVLNVFKQLRSGRPILKSQSRNISLRVGESTTLKCVSKIMRHKPQVSWLKWNKPDELNRLQNVDFSQNDIETHTLAQGKGYKHIVPKQERQAISGSVHAQVRRGKKERSYEFRLTLQHVEEEDSGVYVCLVRNKYGSDYRRYLVNVQSMKGMAPYPTELRPKYLVFPSSSSIRLMCDVAGDNPLTYQWYKNGKKFTRRLRGWKVNSTAPSLRIRTLLPSDSGVYTCRASNPYGVYEHNITLKVLQILRSAPILLKNYPKNVTSSQGKTVVLNCIELASDPMPDYRWYRWHSVPSTYPKLDFRNTSLFTEIDPTHYTPIQVKVGTKKLYGGKLTLENITEDDAGLYSCVLRNQLGMDYASAFLNWRSNEGPKFVPNVHRPTSIKIPPTAPLKLDCDARGDPKPNIIWFRNGKALSPTRGMTLSNYTLTLNELLPQHSGNYTCHLKNIWGSINHTFDVRIKEWLFTRPIIIPSPRKQLRAGERYRLKCTIVSSEPITPSMTRELSYKNEAPEILTSKTDVVKLDKHVYQYSYIIQNATTNDSGVYTCLASNRYGGSRKQFQIQVEA